MSRFHLLLSSIVILAIAGCKKDGPAEALNTQPALQPVFLHTTNNVIIQIYSQLDVAAGQLLNDIVTLQTTRTQQNLDRVRQAWREARIPWENSEAFLFGPVSTEAIDPAIDSWPVNETDLNAVLASNATLTKEYIDGLEGTLKGFHTIEYLIFGTDGNKQLSQFTQREFQYLVAVAQSLQGQTARLVHAWIPAGQNFGANIINAGQQGNALYPSQKAALEELVNGMLTIADEVANGKINDPFVQRDVTLEESRFSNNSKADFQDNIRGILFLYTGNYNGIPGSSTSDIIKHHNQELDARLKAATQTAIERIEAIPGTFTTAIFNNRAEIEQAQAAVRSVQLIIESEVLPLISNRVQ